MEFDKLKEVIADVLNVDPNEVTMETTFTEDLGRIRWMCFRLLWELRKPLK